MPKNIVRTFEFVGSDLEVIESFHEGYVGLEGTVIDETKNTFSIKDDENEKMITKDGTRFKLTILGRENILDGDRLTYRSENRIKKLG